MKAVVAAFNLVGAFSVITNLQMEIFEALPGTQPPPTAGAGQVHGDGRTLTAAAGLINDTEMCLCVSETPFMNIQWTHLDIVKLELHVADASER